MSRCEDYPCCGHAGDPGGCPSRELRTCKDCGVKFHPDDLCWDYCYRCQEAERRRYKPAKRVTIVTGQHCENEDCDQTATIKLDDRLHVCPQCADDIEHEWACEEADYERD